MSTDSWRPTHAYVPGQNSRHEEGAFDFLKVGVAGCSVAALPGTVAWRSAMAFHRDGYHWEAHELLEAIWMACPPNSAEKIYVKAVIQQCNAALKEKMRQPVAAQKIRVQAEALLHEALRRSGGVLFGGLVDATEI
ncbi:MAG: DUF309 domain-containing protein [Pseudomonadota bacterium]